MGTSVNLQLIETVVFPGDTLHCKVDIEPHEDPAANATEASSRIISARIQVYGQYIIDPSKSKHFTEDPQSPVENVEGLPKPDNAHIFFASPSTTMFTSADMKQNETLSYMYSCKLPNTCLPPSYQGQMVKYQYYVIVFIEKELAMQPARGWFSWIAGSNQTPPAQKSTQHLRLPFRLLNPSAGLMRADLRVAGPLACEPSCRVLPNTKPDVMDLMYDIRNSMGPERTIRDNDTRRIMQALFEKYSHPVSININKAEHHLVKFSMDKTIFQPGDILRAVFDFSQGVIPCYQVAVRLELEEELVYATPLPARTAAGGNPSIRVSSEIPVTRAPSAKPLTASSELGAESPMQQPPRVSIISEFHEATHNTSRTSLSFNIPMEASPHFSTNLVSVRWMLRFEFITATLPHDRRGELNIDIAPQECEKLNWQMQIRVMLPNYPYELIDEPRKTKSVTAVVK